MNRSLKIAMISYYLPSGSKIGVGYQVHALANTLTARGHAVTVFSSCGPCEGAKYRTETIPLTGANRTFKFANELRKREWHGFDVLHAHGDDYWLRRGLGPVHVRTLHGSCFDEALHVRGARERLRMVLLGFSEVLASLVADTTVSVSHSTQRWLPWVRMVIPNGVDIARFAPGQRSAEPSVLFVGTYYRRKRGKLLAEVFEQQVLPVIPGAKLWMVCEDAPSAPGVDVLGRISDAELAARYGQAWIFCLPSSYEGFGVPYIEAMAAGCPVVASRNAGAVEVTNNGQLGLLVSDEELGPSLIRLLNSAEARERISGAARSAVGRFDIEAVATSYEALYADLQRRRRRAPAS